MENGLVDALSQVDRLLTLKGLGLLGGSREVLTKQNPT